MDSITPSANGGGFAPLVAEDAPVRGYVIEVTGDGQRRLCELDATPLRPGRPYRALAPVAPLAAVLIG